MDYFTKMNLKNWTIFSLLEPEFVQKIKMACVFGNLGNEALIVTLDDEVFALGSNAAGCLGLGSLHSTLIAKKVEGLCRKRVVGFAYGSGPHVLAFTADGDLYAWGHNGYCELGNGSSNQILSPSVVMSGLTSKTVVQVACGSHHSMILTSEGEVFAWGQNNCGQVGSGMSANQSTPRKVNSGLSNKKCIAISCGQTSSMTLVENGEVFGWGYNGNGQLGIGNNVNQLNPVRVSGLSGVVIARLACGYAHSMALSDIGELYVWGANSYGQLGTGNKSNASYPVRVGTELGRIVDLAAAHYTHISAVLTQGAKVFMWGQCRGQSVTVPAATPFTSLHDVFACFGNPSVMYQPMEVELDTGEKVADSLRLAFDDVNSSDIIISVHGRPIHVHKALLKIRCQHFRSMFQEHWEEDKQKANDKCHSDACCSMIEIDQFSYPVYRAFLQYLYTDEVDLLPESALGPSTSNVDSEDKSISIWRRPFCEVREEPHVISHTELPHEVLAILDNLKHISELLVLASAYCETQLKRRCEQIIKNGITVENAAMLYSTAIEYHASELEDFCFKFFLNHMTAIIQSDGFVALDEVTVKELIRKAAKSGAFKS